MIEKNYFYQNVKFWLWFIGLGGFLAYIITFWPEFWLALGIIPKIVLEFFTDGSLFPTLSLEEVRAKEIFIYGIVGNFFFFNLFLFFFSQFILPVRTLEQRWKMFIHAWLYVLGWHGAAVFVEGGKIHSNKEEMEKELPGVVFIDGNSAVAIEKLWAKGVPKNGAWNKKSYTKTRDAEEELEKAFAIDENIREKRFTDKNATVRVEGPGIVFTSGDERIAGAVSLGKQNKPQPDVAIPAKTRDGIEVVANVKVTFTVGEAPDKLLVAETSPGKFQTVKIKEVNTTNGDKTITQKIIEKFEDSLTEKQNDELIRYKVFSLSKAKKGFGVLEKASKKKQPTQQPRHQVVSNVIFDPARVFHAFYSVSSDPAKNEKLEWTELPAKIAADEFRTLINKENFDDLYQPKNEGSPPIKKVREALKNRMRNLGVLDFELVFRKSHLNYAAVGDDIADSDKYLFLPEHSFEEYEILRERGIKVIDASFGDLVPVRNEVNEQRLAYWQSLWTKQELFTTANQQLEATRIRNQARAQTQQEMIYTLSQIFKTVPHSDEALAMRIYQALEAAATAPIEKKLLPTDTLNMLSKLREWLTLEGEENIGQGPTSNRGVISE
jgi:hypothetical protein